MLLLERKRIRLLREAIIVLAFGVLAGCAGSTTVKYDEVDAIQAEAEVPQAALLDVGILLFDPGVPEGQEEADGFVFPDVRRAEARFMPYHLKRTLEGTGLWGSIWVLPERSDAVDLIVWGRVDESNGLEVEVRIGAWDSTGKEWLNKKYKARVPEKAYSKYRDLSEDPYQNIYNEIANDLLAKRRSMSDKQLTTIRQVAELRFASDLVPAAFASHIEEDDGEYRVLRLPAVDDPMLARMRAVREREYTFVDTLNEYYAGLYYEMSPPYENWRKMSREETINYQELKRSARMRQLLGLAAILGAVAYEAGGGGNSAITNTAILGGIEGIRSGLGKSTEAKLHGESLRELGSSFEAETEPLLIEVEGQTRRLTGTAEEKYMEWRRLLREIFASETGLPQPVDAPNDQSQTAYP
ncbi:MAG: hypothetical protein KJO76_04905 [Gammaproteobacteria bacterium]|nr:hypothetical protein [Gammaproteobacteria bacterium]NND36371.1 hypothetical protein [Gammaproteobacteria bacterium]